MSGERARLEALLEQAEAFASDIVRAYGHFDSWSEDDLGELGRETLRAISIARSKLAQGVEVRVIAREMAAQYVGAATQQGLLALADEKTLPGRARRADGASPGAIGAEARQPAARASGAAQASWRARPRSHTPSGVALPGGPATRRSRPPRGWAQAADPRLGGLGGGEGGRGPDLQGLEPQGLGQRAARDFFQVLDQLEGVDQPGLPERHRAKRGGEGHDRERLDAVFFEPPVDLFARERLVELDRRCVGSEPQMAFFVHKNLGQLQPCIDVTQRPPGH